ncbi:MAG: LuxR C-terminal-related transcriptional regulator [Burkholderiales bacterium]|nr:LuxR C-terminal-related transcriptional regulator [Burkholderiales bacterium]
MTQRGRPPHDDQLTPAEWRVAELVRHGLTNPRIAALMGVSVDAVKFHVANVLVKLGFKSRNDIRHWQGVAKTSPLHSSDRSTSMSTSLGPIGQIARSVKDIKAAEAWYRDVLKLPHLFTFGNLAFFNCDGVRLFLSQNESASDGESILYFRVPDIHAAHAELKSRGVEFTDAPHMIHKHADGTEEWMNFFKDPEGRPLAIMAQVKVGN